MIYYLFDNIFFNGHQTSKQDPDATGSVIQDWILGSGSERNIYGFRTLLATDYRPEMLFSMLSAVVGKRVQLGAVFMLLLF
jgi:hypothetical protein